MEGAFGSFSRSLSLPEGIDADRVTAKPEERKPHRVQIGTGSVEARGTEK